MRSLNIDQERGSANQSGQSGSQPAKASFTYELHYIALFGAHMSLICRRLSGGVFFVACFITRSQLHLIKLGLKGTVTYTIMPEGDDEAKCKKWMTGLPASLSSSCQKSKY